MPVAKQPTKIEKAQVIFQALNNTIQPPQPTHGEVHQIARMKMAALDELYVRGLRVIAEQNQLRVGTTQRLADSADPTERVIRSLLTMLKATASTSIDPLTQAEYFGHGDPWDETDLTDIETIDMMNSDAGGIHKFFLTDSHGNGYRLTIEQADGPDESNLTE